MRFDDSLATVLAADAAAGVGAQSAWRQLVDLVGRGRVPDIGAAIARLRDLRDDVPAAVRAASGRALAGVDAPAALVRFFAEDDLAAAAPILRTAMLTGDDWLALLPKLTPAKRSVLRHRRDLPPEVVRGLASFGATDFVLGHEVEAGGSDPKPPLPTATPSPAVEAQIARPPAPMPAVQPEVAPAPVDLEPAPFVAIGEVARALPVVAEAMRQAADPARFEIADIVARIDAFRRDRPEPAQVAATPAAADRFDFHTDATGVIRWVEGVARAPLIGVDLTRTEPQGVVEVGREAAAAFRARGRFDRVDCWVAGDSSATGKWRLSGLPRFDRGTGRFVGLAGVARRVAEPAPIATGADSLRQLVHELRTPVNAIAGFSQLIGAALLGPVPPVYRERAQLIEREAGGLTTAIDDLDTAARIESDALDLRPAVLDLAPLLTEAVANVQPFAAYRRVTLAAETQAATVRADDRLARLLLDRLLLAALSNAEPDERLRVQLLVKAKGVRLHITRPRALTVGSGDALLALDDAPAGEGGPLLGADFTLRLVRDLATALGGAFAITPDRLTLRLPAAVTSKMERAAAQ
ncbi:histidine kinase dimerization/phospho-acceptor domain-containing protein [Sphingomonas sp.]|uniref:histidine kinase dimerization/phospho-acceptor domain-containing protein n=1 Tax=Sphingomonas sp. TaxID=28214 RepID=UPI003CC6D81C